MFSYEIKVFTTGTILHNCTNGILSFNYVNQPNDVKVPATESTKHINLFFDAFNHRALIPPDTRVHPSH